MLWDAGYAATLPDLDFLSAAIVLTRVVSKPQGNRLCLDLGYKAIAAEFKPGDVLYGVPWHICPTVALHGRATVVRSGRVASTWTISARERTLTI